MPGYEDDFEGDFDDDVFDAPEDADDATQACPYCGSDVYDDAERCPACGNYLSQEDAPLRRRPWWIVVTVAICILLVLSWVFGGIVSFFGMLGL